MNQTTPSHPHGDTPVWQSFGEMKLPVGPDGRDAIRSLLEETLDPLHLPVDLIHRIVKSIQEVTGRAVVGGMMMEHIHLFILVPTNYRSMRGTWGFFRIERIEAGDGDTIPSHAVDLYLYPEGG